MSTVIGFQGDRGSFSEEALLKHFGDVERRNFPSFEMLVEKVITGEVAYGVLPLENSSTGAIKEVYDLLKTEQVFIVGEVIVPISHNLLGIRGASVDKIKKIYSHPQALDQSKLYLGKLAGAELIPYRNTASSAKRVSDLEDETIAAVASKRAAECYGLTLLEEDIQYNSHNYTKFVVLKNEMEIGDKAKKISIIMDVNHEPGALFKGLKIFSDYQLNMMKIESRPIVGRPWEYLFYIDFQGRLDMPLVEEALEELKVYVNDYKLLGNY
jgi:chorismate mutase/prephenate dehydratase